MVYETVVSIICEQFDLEESKVTMETGVTEDLGADSLDLVEVLSAIEDELDVEIPDEVLENMKTVGDLVKYIEDNK